MIIKTDNDTIQNYLEDNSNSSLGNTTGVFVPENEGEIISFLTSKNRKKDRITISGGGTGTTGGRIPYGGYVLSTERLNRIKIIDRHHVIVEPGVFYQDLEKALKEECLLLGPNPTEPTATIGGNIATNASGSRSFKYGSIRNFVTRMKIILSSGDSLDLPRNTINADRNDIFSFVTDSGKQLIIKRPIYNVPQVKNAAGYYSTKGMDLLDLFIGAEGTLGVISEIELKILPYFQNLCAFFVFINTEDAAVNLVKGIKARINKDCSSFDPVCIEYYDANSLTLLQQEFSQLPNKKIHALYIEQNIAGNEEGVLADWLELFEEYGVKEEFIWFGQAKRDLDFYRQIRHALPEKMNEEAKKQHHLKLSSDIAVPEDKLTEMMAYYKQYFSSSQIPYFVFGHIGENHLHTNLLPQSKEQVETAKIIYLELMEKAVSLGGTISAEHGVGKIKHDYLKLMYGEAGIKEMARIKHTLDPIHILNINNVFPESYLI